MAKTKLPILINWIITLGVIVFLASWAACVSQGAMTDCIDATCRITAADGGVGSGCVFEISQGRVYVITAAHVVGSDRTVRCEFWRGGHQSQALAGEVISRSESADAAIIALPEAAFSGLLPAVIPVAPCDYIVPAGATLSSVGCANGTWSTGWKGHALGYSGADLHFLPVPANGRSGSAIFDAEGKMIVALLRARTVNDTEGIATPVQSLYGVFGKVEQQAQCPGGTCPQQSSPAPYLLPYRYRDQFRNQPAPGGPAQPLTPLPAWPTLPAPQTITPAPPKIDLEPILKAQDETNQRLSTITELLANKFNPPQSVESQKPATPPVPTPAPVDDAARKAAEEAKAQVAKVEEENKTILTKFGKIDSIFEKFGGDPETLIQRAMDRVSKVKAELGPNAEPDDVLKGYLKDLAKEKIKEGLAGGLSFDKLISVGGGIPAVSLAIFGCVIVWKLVNNKPLAIENLAPNSFAGRGAAELREHISALVEPIKNQIDAKLNQITGVATEAKAAAEAAKAVSQVVSAQTTSPATTK